MHVLSCQHVRVLLASRSSMIGWSVPGACDLRLAARAVRLPHVVWARRAASFEKIWSSCLSSADSSAWLALGAPYRLPHETLESSHVLRTGTCCTSPRVHTQTPAGCAAFGFMSRAAGTKSNLPHAQPITSKTIEKAQTDIVCRASLAATEITYCTESLPVLR